MFGGLRCPLVVFPKGPGRRPKLLARQRFMELLAEGVPLRLAAGLPHSFVSVRDLSYFALK